MEKEMIEGEKSGNFRNYLSVVKRSRTASALKSMCKPNQLKNKRRLMQNEQAYIERVTYPIPNSKHSVNNFNLFTLLEKYHRAYTIKLDIIETLLVSSEGFVFYFTSNDTVRSITGPQAVSSFFAHCKRYPGSLYYFPKYTFRSEFDMEFVYHEEIARSRLANTKECVIQRFVFPKGNQMSKIRVHWKHGHMPTYYNITNKLAVPKQKELNQSPKSIKLQREELLKYARQAKNQINIIVKQLPMLNEADSTPKQSHSRYFSELSSVYERNRRIKLECGDLFEQTDYPLLLTSHLNRLWSVKKLIKIQEDSLQMVYFSVELLNLHYSCKKRKVKEIVVDFLKDSGHNWRIFQIAQFAACKEKTKQMKIYKKCKKQRNRVSTVDSRKQFMDFVASPSIDRLPSEEEKDSKVQNLSTLELSIKECISEMQNQTVSRPIPRNPPTKQEICEIYNDLYKIDRRGFKGTSFLPISKSAYGSPLKKVNSLLHDNAVGTHYEKIYNNNISYYNESLQKFSAMQNRVKEIYDYEKKSPKKHTEEDKSIEIDDISSDT